MLYLSSLPSRVSRIVPKSLLSRASRYTKYSPIMVGRPIHCSRELLESPSRSGSHSWEKASEAVCGTSRTTPHTLYSLLSMKSLSPTISSLPYRVLASDSQITASGAAWL